MFNDKMVNAMKRNYIIPNTTTESFRTAHLCDTIVGSVQGNTGLQFSEIDGEPI